MSRSHILAEGHQRGPEGPLGIHGDRLKTSKGGLGGQCVSMEVDIGIRG